MFYDIKLSHVKIHLYLTAGTTYYVRLGLSASGPNSRNASMTGEFQSQVSVTWLSLHFWWKMVFNPSVKICRFTINMYAWNQLKYTEDVWINRNLLHHFSFYLYSVWTSNFATWSGLNFKTNVKMVLFMWENLIKTIWLSVTTIAWRNHLGSLS
jgi:hypothetical protein